MKQNTKGMLIMLACPIIWSLSGLVAKYIPWPGLCIAGWRGLLTGLAMYIYMRWAKIERVFNGLTFLIGATVTGTLLLYFASLKMIPAANAVALQYTEPVFLMLFSALFLKKKYKRMDIFVVLMALVGVALLFASSRGANSLLGSLLALLSGVCYALTYFLMTDQSSQVRLSGLLIGNTMAMVGIFTVNPLTLEISPAILGVMLISGLFQISVPHILMTYAMKLTTPLACSLIATLEMVLNPIWVYLFLGEVPGPLSIAGCAVIMISVVAWCVCSAREEAAPERVSPEV